VAPAAIRKADYRGDECDAPDSDDGDGEQVVREDLRGRQQRDRRDESDQQ